MPKIALVERIPDFYNLLNKHLSKEGFDVFNAHDGEKGLELIKKEKPDLVIMDLVLPKKDGFEILEEVKENKECKNIPIIILIKPENLSEAEEALKLGAVTYLVKTNYQPEYIIKIIKKLCK